MKAEKLKLIEQTYKAYSDCPAYQEGERCRMLVKAIPELLAYIAQLEREIKDQQHWAEVHMVKLAEQQRLAQGRQDVINQLQAENRRLRDVVRCVEYDILERQHIDLESLDFADGYNTCLDEIQEKLQQALAGKKE